MAAMKRFPPPSKSRRQGPEKSSRHVCAWDTFHIFAYCGLVVEMQPLSCYVFNLCSPSNINQVEPESKTRSPSALLPPFGAGSPTKTDYSKKLVPLF